MIIRRRCNLLNYLVREHARVIAPAVRARVVDEMEFRVRLFRAVVARHLLRLSPQRLWNTVVALVSQDGVEHSKVH